MAERDISLMYAPENRIKDASVIENTIVTAQVHEPEGIEACLKGMKNRPSYLEFLKTLPIPLHCIFGLQDHYIAPEKARETAAILGNAKVRFLKSSGHNGFLEEPLEVISFI